MIAKFQIDRLFRTGEYPRDYRLRAWAFVDGRYIEVNLVDFDIPAPFNLYLGKTVVIRFVSTRDMEEYHFGEKHISYIKLVKPEIVEFIGRARCAMLYS